MSDNTPTNFPTNPKLNKEFLLTTWSGRIMLVNGIIFILMTVLGGEILMPSNEILLQFGAKDPVKLIQGEWWRYITPIFVHIGIIHFFFNSYALKYVGSHLENILSPSWFLFLYITTGIAGNVSSSLFNIGVGAGASGAIFGLIGAGYVIEKSINDYAEQVGLGRSKGMYASLAIINLALGFMIPAIDNAAHIGGFVTGIALTFAMLYLKPNRVKKLNKTFGISIIGFVMTLLMAGMYFGMSEGFIKEKILDQANDNRTKYFVDINDDNKVEYGIRSYQLYTRILDIDPGDQDVLFNRGSLLVLSGDYKAGFEDFTKLARTKENERKLRDLAGTLSNEGKEEIAQVILSMIQ